MTVITTQTEAKRFFVDKVVAQAKSEGVPLSDAEREILLWSESDPGLTIDPALPARLQAEISDEDYERKIVGLLVMLDEAMAQGGRNWWQKLWGA